MANGDGQGPRDGSYQKKQTDSKGKKQLTGKPCPVQPKK